MRIRLRVAFIFCSLLLLGIGIHALAQDNGDVLLEDDFEDSKQLRDWMWSEDDHDFVRVATDGENRVLRLIGGEEGADLYSDDSEDWENYALELRFKIVTPTDTDGYDLVLVVRDDLDNLASAGAIIASDSSEAVIATYFDEQYQEFDNADYEFNIDEWYAVRFAVRGEQLELTINGEVVAATDTDEQGERGGVGLVAGINAVILFDDVRVTALSVQNQIAAEFGDDISSLIDSSRNNTPEVVATAEVVVNTANLRGGPSTNFDVVGTARRGDTFDIIAQTGVGDDVWYLIDDEETWIFSGVVTIDPEDAEIPDVEDIEP